MPVWAHVGIFGLVLDVPPLKFSIVRPSYVNLLV